MTGNTWELIFVGFAACASVVSAFIACRALGAATLSASAAKKSASAAERSAIADERSVQLTEAEAQSRRAEWKIEKLGMANQAWIVGLGTARITNVGDEMACNVRISGERIAKVEGGVDVHKNRSLQFFYSITVTNDKAYLPEIKFEITWDRPEQFGEKNICEPHSFRH